MTLAEYLEAYRLQRIGQLEHEQQSLIAKISDLETAKVAGDAALTRAERPYPNLNICPQCWGDHEIESAIKRIGPGIGDEPIGEFEVLMRCSRCSWEQILTE